MAENFSGRVGSEDYKGTYEVKGDKVSVTVNGQTKEDALINQPPLYKARDLAREMFRDKKAA